VLAGQLGPPLLAQFQASPSVPLRLLLGFVVFDLTKAPALAATAWLVGPLIGARPKVHAATLVLLTYLFEVVVAALLGQVRGMVQRPWLLLGRVVAVALLVALVAAILRRRRAAQR
jgi:hypothetical protein